MVQQRFQATSDLLELHGYLKTAALDIRAKGGKVITLWLDDQRLFRVKASADRGHKTRRHKNHRWELYWAIVTVRDYHRQLISVVVVVDGEMVLQYGTTEALPKAAASSISFRPPVRHPTAPRVFISYRRQDIAFAQELYNALVRAGYQPWLDLTDIPRGANFETEIDQALKTAHYVVVIASPWSLGRTQGSKFVYSEWFRALENRTPVLLVLVQALASDDVQFLNAAYQQQTTPYPEPISWMDARENPLSIGEKGVQWLKNPACACTSALPTNRRIPPAIRFRLRVAEFWCVWVLVSMLAYVSYVQWQIDRFPLEDMPQYHLVRSVALLAMLVFLLIGVLRRMPRVLSRSDRSYDDAMSLLNYAFAGFLVTSIGVDASILLFFPAMDEVPLEQTLPEALVLLTFPALLIVSNLAAARVFDFLHDYLGDTLLWRSWIPTYEGSALVKHPRRAAPVDLSGIVAPQAALPALPSAPPADSGVKTLNVKPGTVGVAAASADRPFARSLTAFLRSNDVPLYGDLERAECLIVIISAWLTQDTATLSLVETAARQGRNIIPVLLEDVPIDDRLKLRNRIDARFDLENARQEVLATLQGTGIRLSQTRAPLLASDNEPDLPAALTQSEAFGLFYLMGGAKPCVISLTAGFLIKFLGSRVLPLLMVLVFAAAGYAALTLPALIIGRRTSATLLKKYIQIISQIQAVAFLPVPLLMYGKVAEVGGFTSGTGLLLVGSMGALGYFSMLMMDYPYYRKFTANQLVLSEWLPAVHQTQWRFVNTRWDWLFRVWLPLLWLVVSVILGVIGYAAATQL